MTGAAQVGLEQGARALGLSLSEMQIGQLLDYLSLIQKWNRVYNLTAVREAGDMLTHHLLDSLAVVLPLRRELEALRQRRVVSGSSEVASPLCLLDVGSGAGLPGVVLAVTCPDLEISCVDTVAKKASFIQQVAITLRLSNLRGVHARVESLSGPFDVVSSRAFASLPDFANWSKGALAPDGIWMAMKAKHPADEVASLPDSVSVFHVEPLSVPGLGAERCLIWMRRVDVPMH